MSRRFDSAVLKLHLEPGDALVVNGHLLNPEEMRFTNAPRDVRIFPVFPTPGQTIKNAFTTIHAMELESLTRQKLTEMMRVFLGNCGGHASAIIDGIERDFCDCIDASLQSCAIHERCAALRYLLKGERACICDGLIPRSDCPVHNPKQEILNATV